MASRERITDNLPAVRDPHDAPGRGRADDPVEEATLVRAVSAAGSSDGPAPLYLPACGALCDILWWARRKS